MGQNITLTLCLSSYTMLNCNFQVLNGLKLLREEKIRKQKYGQYVNTLKYRSKTQGIPLSSMKNVWTSCK